MEAAIRKQLLNSNIKRDCDVHELYLTQSNSFEAPDLGRFKFLKKLYLNENKILHLSNCLEKNYVLTNLYLQNNRINEISGALRHLTCLEELMLHGNQLTNLPDVLHEFENMQALKMLSLHGNPLAQDLCYRDLVLYSIPSIELLDRKVVTPDEKAAVERKYHRLQPIKDTIAFGRRLEKSEVFQKRKELTDSDSKENDKDIFSEISSVESSADNVERELNLRNMPPEEKYASAIEERGKNRSVMQYSVFNWTDHSTKNNDCPSKQPPTVFSTKFR